MIVDVTKGDVVKNAVEGKYDAIVQGCNCWCRMGAGVALTIKNVFPEAWEADQKTIPGDRTKLGTYTKADVQIEYGTVYKRIDMVTIINAYTQFDYGTDKMNVDYEAIEKVFTQINIDYADMNIGIPMIGAGLARGDWSIISEIINRVTPALDVHLVEYNG